MRKHIWISCLLVILVATVGLLLWQHDRNMSRTDTDQVKQISATTQTKATNQVQNSINSPSIQQSRMPAVDRVQKLRASVDSMNVPIAFWGKVVDQDGKPLAGAKVKIGIRKWFVTVTLGAEAKNIRHEFVTGSDGIFTVSEPSGDVVSIEEISKEGYELSSKMVRAFNYGRGSVANPDNPALFAMWKRGEPQNLLKFDKDLRIPYDGTPVTFDLLKGTRDVGANISGDLRITLLRTPLKIQLGRRENYDWTATIEAPNGEVIESVDEFMYRAPENGYSAKIEIKMSASDPLWSPNKSVALYFKSRSGQCYGRAIVEFRTGSDQPTTGFTLKTAINSSGSRSVE